MSDKSIRVEYTKQMKKENYTILAPQMLPIHFALIEKICIQTGYNLVILQNDGRAVVDTGLKYVHNDTCYPALLVIGQFIDALNSGKYDVNKTALMITQTGGGCRASNYIHLLRKALIKADYGFIPVISLNPSGLEKNSGFKLTIPFLRKLIAALAYGDLLMLLSNQTKPYEVFKGESMALVYRWVDKLKDLFEKNKGLSKKDLKKYCEEIAKDFNEIKIEKTKKVKVGVVGEIYVKYSPLANNNLEDFLNNQGCEVMVPGLMGFIIFKTDNRIEDIKLYGGSKIKRFFVKILMDYLLQIESIANGSVKNYDKFIVPSSYLHMKSLIDGVIGFGNKMGEGWLLTAEMMELIENGYKNIVCAQPFGCLPNHIVGKGMIRQIKNIHNDSNIVPVDYDPGATKVNQENRIKLMLAVAGEELENTEKEALSKAVTL